MGRMGIYLSLCPASAFREVSAFRMHTSERTGNHAIRLSFDSNIIQSHRGWRELKDIRDAEESMSWDVAARKPPQYNKMPIT